MNVIPLHSLRGASLEAFERVGEIVESHMRRIHPRICLLHCDYCGGSGKYRAIVVGKWLELACTQCSGRGTIAAEA